MDSRHIETPALFSLLLFLGVNYLTGYEIGRLSGSTTFAVAMALVTPCLCLLGLAMLGSRQITPEPDSFLDEA